jgi:hypothetical protein
MLWSGWRVWGRKSGFSWIVKWESGEIEERWFWFFVLLGEELCWVV